MALQKTVKTPQGFNAVDAYHKVDNVFLLTKSTMQFVVRSFKNKEQSAAFAEDMYSCDYDLNGLNPIAQAYQFAKTLEKFDGAEDC